MNFEYELVPDVPYLDACWNWYATDSDELIQFGIGYESLAAAYDASMEWLSSRERGARVTNDD